MNLGGDAADQIVRYSLDGMDHGLRLSGTMAKNLAVFIAAVLKDQKKTHGKTNMLRMLKDNKPMKFFTVPADRLKEFCKEGKKRGLLYVVIRDRKNPQHCELMVFADDAAKVNRVMDQMNLDFVKSESGEAVHETVCEAVKEEPVKTETVAMPEGEVAFEISNLDEDFNILGGTVPEEVGNFTKAQEMSGNPSEPSLRSNATSTVQENEKPSVRKELQQIKDSRQEAGKKSRQRNRKRNRANVTRRQKKKAKGR